MRTQVIQGFFVGGQMRAMPGVPNTASRHGMAVPEVPRVGAPPAAFVGTSLVRQRGSAAPLRAPHGRIARVEIDPAHLGLARTEGAPMPKPILAKMEAALDADFSAVRIHVGPQASRIGAIAFTNGNDIYFAPGRYQPDSVQGQQLLGHELAHVIQQRQGRVRAFGSGISVVQDPMLEAEADRLGARAIMHTSAIQPKMCATAQSHSCGAQSSAPVALGPRSHRPATANRRSNTGSLRLHGGKAATDIAGLSVNANRRTMALQAASGGGRRHHSTPSFTGRPAIQPMLAWFAGVTATDLPKNVELLKSLQAGYRIGYCANDKKIGIYDGNAARIAYVEVQQSGPRTIILHTRTESGEEGGQGYIALLFGASLRILKRDYYAADREIWMSPAPGAATKGLITQLSRLRERIVGPDRNMFSATRRSMGARFLETANALRTSRKKAASGGGKPGAQTWNSAAMLETAWELNAIAEFERASPTGLRIVGAGAGFSKELVGLDAPALEGGALAWHKVGRTDQPGTLTLTFPMAAIDAYIQALPN